MDKDAHCRLCGSYVENLTTLHRPCSKFRFQRDIHASLGLDVSNDNSLDSDFICRNCQRKLEKWRKAKNKYKSARISIKLQQTPYPSVWKEIEVAAVKMNMSVQESSDSLSLYKFDTTAKELSHSVTIKKDMTWTVKIYRYDVPKTNEMLATLPNQLDLQSATKLFDTLLASKLCCGNTGFEDLCRLRSETNSVEFKGLSGQIIAREEQGYFGQTVRHTDCTVLCVGSEQCSVCALFRGDLFSRRSRLKQSAKPPCSSSRVRNDYLTRDDLEIKLKKSQKEKQVTKRRNDDLLAAVENQVRQHGVEVQSVMGEAFNEIMINTDVNHYLKENTPARLLWQQQLEFSNTKDPRRMRWHPAMIRWCIALFAKSPAAYRVLKKSKFLFLPHENTLREYTNFTTACSGINPKSIERLVTDFGLKEIDDFKQNVAILFDEIKVKSGFVFKDGHLIGFCELGSVNEEFNNFERAMSETDEPPAEATHILTVMVRGIFSQLEAVLAHYPSVGFTSYQLYWVIWDAVAVAEAIGLKVRALVSDGASPNRKFYRHIAQDNEYFTVNRFTTDNRRLFLISDAPHLMKTTRNNWENSGWNGNTRHLHVS